MPKREKQEKKSHSKNEKIKKAKKARVKSLRALAETEEENWRIRQFFMLVLLADKTRMQVLEEEDKNTRTNS